MLSTEYYQRNLTALLQCLKPERERVMQQIERRMWILKENQLEKEKREKTPNKIYILRTTFAYQRTRNMPSHWEGWVSLVIILKTFKYSENITQKQSGWRRDLCIISIHSQTLKRSFWRLQDAAHCVCDR